MARPASLKRNNFDQLKAFVSDGLVRIIDIDTVPRSVSTALGRALNESSERSIYIHEPFDKVGQDLDEVSAKILVAAEPFVKNTSERTTIITKNFARNVTEDTYEKWRSICGGVVYLVRDPRAQIGSFLLRFANDLCIDPGADVLRLEEMRGEYLEVAVNHIEAGGSGQRFSRTSWFDLGEHFKNRHKYQQFTVVDSLELTRNPEKVLRTMCEELELVFHDRMVSGWRNRVVNANQRTWNQRDTKLDSSSYNGWIGRAMFSTGFGSNENQPLNLADLPESVRKHLIEVALPVYQEIIGSKKLKTTNLYWPRKQAKEQPLEIVEHKAEGHPDSVCDILSAATIDAYTKKLAGELGGIPNGSFDKVAIAGGEARIDFGACEVLKPPTIYLFGKAMSRNDTNRYMRPLFRSVVDEILGDIFGRSLTGRRLPKAAIDLVVNVNSGIGAEHDPKFYTATKKPVTNLWDYRLSNDTIACAGWYPFTRHEKLTVELANYINGPAFKAEFPETGRDVKVLTTRLNKETHVTVCVPFLASLTPSFNYYERRKIEIEQKVTQFVKERIGPHITIKLNTKDVPGRGYLTVFGSAFDKGDCGMTGRGNRYPGFISLNRPSGVEAFSGKNPFNHTGRIYTALAFELARLIWQETGIPTTTYMTALNGDPLGKPHTLRITQNNRDVTTLYQEQAKQALQLMNKPLYGQELTALQAFRTGYGLF